MIKKQVGNRKKFSDADQIEMKADYYYLSIIWWR